MKYNIDHKYCLECANIKDGYLRCNHYLNEIISLLESRLEHTEKIVIEFRDKLNYTHEVMGKANIAAASGDDMAAFMHLNTYLCKEIK